MNCPSPRELASFMDGELSPARRHEVACHLETCAACRHELDQLGQTTRALSGWGEVAPPPGLLARIAATVAVPALAGACSCATVHSALDDYAQGHTRADDSRAFTRHLAECAACADKLGALEQVVGLVRLLPSVEPPARLRERVLREGARRARPVFVVPSFRGLMATAGAAAAAAVVLAMMQFGASQPAGREESAALPSAVERVDQTTHKWLEAMSYVNKGAEKSAAAVGRVATSPAVQHTAAAPQRIARGVTKPMHSSLTTARRRTRLAANVQQSPAPVVVAKSAIVARPSFPGSAQRSRVQVADRNPRAGGSEHQPMVVARAPVAEPEAGLASPIGMELPGESARTDAASPPARPLAEVREAVLQQDAGQAPTLRPDHRRSRTRERWTAWTY